MRLDISRKIRRVCMVLMMLFIMPVISLAAENPSESLKAVNGIPLVIVYVNENADDIAAANAADPDNTYGTIQDMNTSKDHSVRSIGSVKIVLPETGKYSHASVPADPITMKFIRGRGNSTWSEGEVLKKPYKIKFTDAVDLFGMGADTEWALMANENDSTLLRNRITSWLGDEIGLPFTPQSVPADFVMIGVDGDDETYREYLGSYDLSELVDIGEYRVNIPKLKKSDKDTDVITGGYLLDIYNVFQDEDLPDSTHFRTDSGIRLTNKNPEFESEDLKEGQRRQREYIRDYIRDLDDLIMKSEEITPEIHDQIASLIDLRSLADYWWVQEFTYNTDAYGTGSTYMYKDRGGKLCMGPLWDFDLAWLIASDEEEGYAPGFNTTEFQWTDTLREKDPLFAELLKERWNDADSGMYKKLCEITDQSGLMDQYINEIRESWTADNELMKSLSDEVDADLDRDTEKLRTWIIKRREWMNNNIDYVGKVHFTISYENENGDVFHTEKIRGSSPLHFEPEAPEKEGYVFTGWKEKETGADHTGYVPYDDTTFCPVYAREDEVTAPEEIFFAKNEVWSSVKDGFYGNPMKILPEDAVVGKITRTSSDESVAKINNYDDIELLGTGDAVITVTLRNGVSKSFTLHVYDPDLTPAAYPESVCLPDVTLDVGEIRQLIPEFLRPENRPMPDCIYSFEFSDTEPVQVIDDEKGVVKGLSPGKTEVTFTATLFGTDNVTLTATCNITVTGDETGPAPAPAQETAKELAAPSIDTKASFRKKQMTIILGAVDGAAGYQVAYRKAGTGPWKTIPAAGNTAVIGKMKKGGLYQIRAAAVDSNKKPGKYSGIRYCFFRDLKKVRFKARKASIRAAWKKSKGASGYQILISGNKDLKDARIITVKGRNKKGYTIKGLEKGKRYYIAVRPYKTKGGKRYIGIRSRTKSLKVR